MTLLLPGRLDVATCRGDLVEVQVVELDGGLRLPDGSVVRGSRMYELLRADAWEVRLRARARDKKKRGDAP